MLILSMRPRHGESIFVIEDGRPIVEIVITEVKGIEVRMGLQAPQNIEILRSKLVAEDKVVEYRALLRPSFVG